jgi:asparagine synthase (glutamine-hydrolysing)
MHTYTFLDMIGHSTLLTPEFQARVDLDEPARAQRDTYGECSDRSVVNRMLAYDWVYTLAENDLPKVTGTAHCAGVEVGFPLLSEELVDFSLRLPADQKLRGLRLRAFFKDSLKEFLPPEILSKKKHGFGLPFGVWATRNPALQAFASARLKAFGARRIVPEAFVTELLQKRLPEHPGYYGELVWILMMLEEWLSKYAPDFRVR